MRKLPVVATVVVVIAIITAACTPGGPAPRNWKVSPLSVKVVAQEEHDDGGDEPYVVQLGFRSKLGVPGSTDAFTKSQCWAHSLTPKDTGSAGTTVNIPPGAADIPFPNAQNLNIGDVLLKTAPLEIFGTISFAMERDGVFSSCHVTDALNSALVGVMKDSLELLIANSAVPPTQEQLISMIVSHIDDFIRAGLHILVAQLEGLGDADDIVGIVVQIHLPTAGAFTSLLNVGLKLAGLASDAIDGQGNITIDGLASKVKIKVGNLLPSTSVFDIDTPGGPHYILTTAVQPG